MLSARGGERKEEDAGRSFNLTRKKEKKKKPDISASESSGGKGLSTESPPKEKKRGGGGGAPLLPSEGQKGIIRDFFEGRGMAAKQGKKALLP